MFSRRSFLKHAAGAFALTALPFSTASHAGTVPFSSTRLLMGTFVTIHLSDVTEGHAAEAMEQTFGEMARLEQLLTRYQSSSPLGTLNASGMLSDGPLELLHVVRAAQSVHRQTAGFFDPSVLPLLEAQRCGRPRREAASLVGMDGVRLSKSGIRYAREGMMMSLDGIAKGYIADTGAALLERLGVKNFLVDAGGDIVARGNKNGKPWKVAVQDPSGQGAYPAVIPLKEGAVATSGIGEQGEHIIDPVNGARVRAASATVIASTAMEADALATALCVMPDPITFINSMPGTACLIVGRDGVKRPSSLWPA